MKAKNRQYKLQFIKVTNCTREALTPPNLEDTSQACMWRFLQASLKSVRGKRHGWKVHLRPGLGSHPVMNAL